MLYKSLVIKISIPPEKKTKQKEYLEIGLLPIVDQGKEIIGGYTNEVEKNIVCRNVSPIVISRKGKECKKFYTMEEFKAEEKKLKGYTHKYVKGLGGLSDKESKEMYQDPKFLYFKKDEAADSMFRKWFAKVDSDTRKNMLK